MRHNAKTKKEISLVRKSRALKKLQEPNLKAKMKEKGKCKKDKLEKSI